MLDTYGRHSVASALPHTSTEKRNHTTRHLGRADLPFSKTVMYNICQDQCTIQKHVPSQGEIESLWEQSAGRSLLRERAVSGNLLHSTEVHSLVPGAKNLSCWNSCHPWLIKIARKGLAERIRGVVVVSFKQDKVPECLKKAVVRSLLKHLSLNPTVLGNYWPVSNIQFWCRNLECMVVSHFQRFLDEANYLVPLQYGFSLVMEQRHLWSLSGDG